MINNRVKEVQSLYPVLYCDCEMCVYMHVEGYEHSIVSTFGEYNCLAKGVAAEWYGEYRKVYATSDSWMYKE